MTGKTLKAQVLRFTSDNSWEDTIPATDTLVCDWINSALSEYPPEAFNPVEYIYNSVETNIEYALPEDFIRATRYIVNNQEYLKSDMVVTTDTNSVYFPEAIDTISLFYYAAQEPYTNKNEELPLRLQFHAVIYYYLLSLYYAQSGEGDNEETIMSTMFKNQYLSQQNALLVRLTSKGITDAVATTDVLPKKRRRKSYGATLDEEGFLW